MPAVPPDDLASDRLLRDVPTLEGYKVLGKVVLYRRLGKGGMGVVYVGRHRLFELDVAVKCLGSDLADDEEFVRRFRHEARSAVALTHQNIVRVFDVGEDHGVLHLVMEYVDGESAGDRVKRKGPLPEHEALAIVLGAAQGLAHAHSRGFVHRDVKPDNILVSRAGKVKLADLGLAKPLDDAARSFHSKSGVGFGTPAYMAPEQARDSSSVGFAADIYAIGATLFALLAGQAPYRGRDVFDVLRQAQDGPFPDIRALRPDVSTATAELIECTTRIDPRDRLQDAREFARRARSAMGGKNQRLADAKSGALGETRPVVSPPPRDALQRIPVRTEKRVAPRAHRATPPAARRRSRLAIVSVGIAALATALVAALFAPGIWRGARDAPSESAVATHAPIGPDVGRSASEADDARLRSAVAVALEWLEDHQDETGRWDCDGFMVECDVAGAPLSDGPGEPLHDVGVTGLALLAFLENGHTLHEGRYKEVVHRGVQWLLAQQQHSGLFGLEISKEFLYDHAIASLAMCEAYHRSQRPSILRPNAQRAADFIQRARNPYAGWRYSATPDGDNDTSVTGWMVAALAAAQEGGLEVDPEALRGALSWFDEMTAPDSGRVGYARDGGRGGASARTGANNHYSRDVAETMTAVATHARIVAMEALDAEDPATEALIRLAADLMVRRSPTWSADGQTNDMYYWYYGTHAMVRIGGPHRTWWQAAMERAVLPHQRTDGCFAGSWDPSGPWGYCGGRVYSTALMALSLEALLRNEPPFGARG